MLKKQQGLGLIEILIGISLSLAIMVVILQFFTSITSSSSAILKTVRLEYQVRTALDLMANDIRRAGYWNNSKSMLNSGANSNPFMSPSTDLITPTASCILFAYDLNTDGVLPILNTPFYDERFGYRLQNEVLQSRSSTGSELNCSSGAWENLTDPKTIKITHLTFVINSSAIPLTNPATSETLLQRAVSISITGQLAQDPSVSITLSTTIKVRNDKYQP